MDHQILVFRTSASRKRDVKQMDRIFKAYPQISRWNVDLEDWEKVLRIECNGISAETIIALLRELNIYAQELT